MNIVDPVYAHARERAAHPALEDDGRVVSYAALAALIDHAAAALSAKPIGRGDIVMIALPDTTEHVAVQLALAKLGAVSLTVSEGTQDAELLKMTEGVTIRAAIVSDGVKRVLDFDTTPVGAVFASGTAGRGASPGIADLDEDAPLMMIQSSGTTGDPKRFFVSHGHMAELCRRLVAILGLTPADRYLQVPYMRFYAGRRRGIAMLRLGGTVVLNHASSVPDYARYFSGHGITYVHMTPFHLRALLASATSDTPAWPRLKIVIGAAPTTSAERQSARAKLTPHVFEAFGTNETGDLALARPADQDLHPDAVGRVLDEIQAQVVDANGTPLPFGEEGRIRFRGPHFPSAYLDNPAATARHFEDGWFYPGDLAALDANGYFFFKGRADDVINNAGVKYYPMEVEAVLRTHPSIVDVAVVGGPHPSYGEASVAFVVYSSKLSANEVFEFCKGKIALYKAPQWVFALNEIPKVSLGKPDRKKLRGMFRRYLDTRPR